jgi:hypothetical protein
MCGAGLALHILMHSKKHMLSNMDAAKKTTMDDSSHDDPRDAPDKPEVLQMTYKQCMSANIVQYKPSFVSMLHDLFAGKSRPFKPQAFSFALQKQNKYHMFDDIFKVFVQRAGREPIVLLNQGIFQAKRTKLPEKHKREVCACHTQALKNAKLMANHNLHNLHNPHSLAGILKGLIWMPSVDLKRDDKLKHQLAKGVHWVEWMDAKLADKYFTVAKLLKMKPGTSIRLVCQYDEWSAFSDFEDMKAVPAKTFFAKSIHWLHKTDGPTGLECTSDSMINFAGCGTSVFKNTLLLFKYRHDMQHSLVQSITDKTCVVWDGLPVKARDLEHPELMIISNGEYPVFEASALNNDLVYKSYT